MISESVIRKLTLSKTLFNLGKVQLLSRTNHGLFAGVNLLQDSIESFLLGIAEHLECSIDKNTAFDKYFEIIDKRINPSSLPFKTKILNVNRIRVNAKHHGLLPASEECKHFPDIIDEFFQEVSKSQLSQEYWSINLISLIKLQEVRDYLFEAERYYNLGDFGNVLISCRKAIFLSIEHRFDISGYNEPPGSGILGLLGAYSEAPSYARSKEYIQNSVADPTDYVVVDRAKIDELLWKSGVDQEAYWNVCRLTPEVFRFRKSDQWAVKEVFSMFEPDDLKNKADYVLPTTIEILIAIQPKHSETRAIQKQFYLLELNEDRVPLYRCADDNSEVVASLPMTSEQLISDFNVTGFDKNTKYYRAMYTADGKEYPVVGYVHEKYIKI